MDVKSAAIQVLQQAGTALHAKDIAALAIWRKTPYATVSARLYSGSSQKTDRKVR